MTDDAFGAYLLARLGGRETRAEFIERDDGLLDTGGMAGPYFLEYSDWGPAERKVVDLARGRVLDIGCGAGRHCLYLQSRRLDVTGIDTSPGAVQVCRQRGVRSVLVSSIDDLDRFQNGTFDTILMLGANFGLLAGAETAWPLLAKLHRVTSSGARILANTRDPYVTDDQDHLAYHERNRRLGKLPGQVRLRVRYRRLIGPWFDYLFVVGDGGSACSNRMAHRRHSRRGERVLRGDRQAVAHGGAEGLEVGNQRGDRSFHEPSFARGRSIATCDAAKPMRAQNSAAPPRPARSAHVICRSSPMTARTSARPKP